MSINSPSMLVECGGSPLAPRAPHDRPASRPRSRLLAAVGFTFVLVSMAIASPARADGLSLKLEPGVAIPLSAPQSERFDTGGSQSVKALFGLTPYLDIGPTASFTFLPAASPLTEAGTVWGFGGGLRLKRPHHDAEGFNTGGISPWFDFDAMYIRTGDLNRLGFAAGVGAAFALGDDHQYWVGPFVRYMQTVQTEHEGYDNRDAKILIAGLSVEFGAGKARPAAAAYPDETGDAEPAAIAPVETCPDRDADTIPDSIDTCPDVPGTMEYLGCPAYKKVVVQRDMLQLRDKLYFALDEAVLEPESLPILDEVAQVLKDNPGFRVQVEGHTDTTGGEGHNQDLSERRAEVVVRYLTAKGVAPDRLKSKGFSSSQPLDTNTTTAGRDNNRRVEFVVNFVIVK